MKALRKAAAPSPYPLEVENLGPLADPSFAERASELVSTCLRQADELRANGQEHAAAKVEAHAQELADYVAFDVFASRGRS